jgi:hypothetical protein
MAAVICACYSHELYVWAHKEADCHTENTGILNAGILSVTVSFLMCPNTQTMERISYDFPSLI